MLIGINGLERAFPRPDFFVHHAPNHGDRMKMEIAANVNIAQTRAEE